MRRLVPLLLALAACKEPSTETPAPLDRFVYPSSLAVTTRADGGGTALLVASGNYDLAFDGATGGSVLSVVPALAADGGSAGAPGGALVRLGAGAQVASFAGQLAVVDAATCPWAGTAARPPEVLLATRFADQVWRLPLGSDGAVGPCPAGDCVIPFDPDLHDPFSLALACRRDGLRRTAFVGYLRTGTVGASGTAGWIGQVDLDDPAAAPVPLYLGSAGIPGLAYDAQADRLYALSEPVLAAPVYVLDLKPCPDGLATCGLPSVAGTDLYPSLPGLDLQAIALSNPQVGLGRRAYVTARVYDPVLASLIRARPSSDIDAVLLVLDLEDGPNGRPSLEVLRVVNIGMGASQVVVLPARPPTPGGAPRRDVVVASSLSEGVVTVYDDEEGLVARVIPIDTATGAPEAGRQPFGLAVDPAPQGTPAAPAARIYVAAVKEDLVGIIDVPLGAPGQAHALRDPASGALVRIGGLQ